MDHNQRSDQIVRNEDNQLNIYLDSRDLETCANTFCKRTPYTDYKGEKYCRYCYQDLIEREEIDALDRTVE